MATRALSSWSIVLLVGLGGGCASRGDGSHESVEAAMSRYAERVVAPPGQPVGDGRVAKDVRWLLGADDEADAARAVPDFAEGAARLQRWEAATAQAAWMTRQREASQDRAKRPYTPSPRIAGDLRRLAHGRPLKHHRSERHLIGALTEERANHLRRRSWGGR